MCLKLALMFVGEKKGRLGSRRGMEIGAMCEDWRLVFRVLHVARWGSRRKGAWAVGESDEELVTGIRVMGISSGVG